MVCFKVGLGIDRVSLNENKRIINDIVFRGKETHPDVFICIEKLQCPFCEKVHFDSEYQMEFKLSDAYEINNDMLKCKDCNTIFTVAEHSATFSNVDVYDLSAIVTYECKKDEPI